MRAATQAQLQADNAFLQARKSLFEVGQRGIDFVWGEVAGYERQLQLLQKNDSWGLDTMLRPELHSTDSVVSLTSAKGR